MPNTPSTLGTHVIYSTDDLMYHLLHYPSEVNVSILIHIYMQINIYIYIKYFN